jgi:hypothetical protein
MLDLRRPAFLAPPPLARPAFLAPPPLAPPLLDTDPGALACNVSGPGVVPPPGSISPPRLRPAARR